jgi:hypothetical protein
MQNYAEELAYWYLRLNGFFLISNYVYHQIQEESQRAYNADADLLAIRPPFYYEEIPHLERDENGISVVRRAPLDSDEWLNEYDQFWVGVIAEVKGSDQTKVQHVRKAFTRGRLRVALNRLGLISDVDITLERLTRNSKFDFEGASLGSFTGGSILKILFSQLPLEGPWMNILLPDMDDFIINRMTSAENYLAKSGSRYFFPSELIQYMIWSSKKARSTQIN